MTRVLPVPAPARIKTGPWIVSTASRCCGFNEFRFNMRARSVRRRGANATNLRLRPASNSGLPSGSVSATHRCVRSQPMNLPEPSEGGIPLMPAADTRAKTFALTTGRVRLSEKAGDRIGRYKLLQQIGEGGCGVVYMAEQEEPVRRRVALKVIKLGMDTTS